MLAARNCCLLCCHALSDKLGHRGSGQTLSKYITQAPLEERCDIAHHLLDILAPAEDFSAADFFRRARQAATDILEVRALLHPKHLPDLTAPELPSMLHLNAAAGSAKACCVSMQRGRTPVVVGGTGFYLRWFVHGRPQTPAPDAKVAAEAEAVLAEV